jgi:hypothetical protein
VLAARLVLPVVRDRVDNVQSTHSTVHPSRHLYVRSRTLRRPSGPSPRPPRLTP